MYYLTHKIMNKPIAITFVLLMMITVSAWAQTKPMDNADMPSVSVVSAIDVEEMVEGEPGRATTFELTFKPGQISPPHRHPGAVYGYVTEGEFSFKVEGKPQQTLKAGEAFYEPTMILHEVAQSASETEAARVVAVVVHPRSAEQLVIPVEAN